MSEDASYSNLLKALDEATPSTWKHNLAYDEPVENIENILKAGPANPIGGQGKRTRTRDSDERITQNSFSREVEFKYLVLNNLHKERLRQLRATFATALIALIFGILLVFIGIILAFAVNLSLGIITTVSSAVTGIISRLAFKFHADANTELNRISKELIVVEQTRLATELIEKISDQKSRDDAFKDLLKHLQSSSLISAWGDTK